jgi:hypothetical protein
LWLIGNDDSDTNNDISCSSIGGSKAEGVRELGNELSIWAKDGKRIRRLRKIAL